MVALRGRWWNQRSTLFRLLRISPVSWLTADAIHNRQNSVGDTRELMNRLTKAQRERAWVEFEEQLSRFEGPNGLEVPGEVLIGVGTK